MVKMALKYGSNDEMKLISVVFTRKTAECAP